MLAALKMRLDGEVLLMSGVNVHIVRIWIHIVKESAAKNWMYVLRNVMTRLYITIN